MSLGMLQSLTLLLDDTGPGAKMKSAQAFDHPPSS